MADSMINTVLDQSIDAASYVYQGISKFLYVLCTPAKPGTTQFALKVASWIVIVVYGFVPYIIYQFDCVGRSLVFQTFMRKHPLDFNHPECTRIRGIRNFYIESRDNKYQVLGVWHIVPKSLLSELQETDEFYMQALMKNYRVFLYFHGIHGSRAAIHRTALYQVLQNMDCHVITFDYRGFGDSSDIEAISETTLVEDGLTMVHWVQNNVSNSQFYVWGHSLGAAVLVHTMYEYKDNPIQPQGIVLEAGFNNMLAELEVHPLTTLYQWIPGFQDFMVNKFTTMDLLFESDKYIQDIKLQLLILHAKDDGVIPTDLGIQLYESAVKKRNISSNSVKLVLFSKRFGFGHKSIILSEDLYDIISKFFTKWSNALGRKYSLSASIQNTLSSVE